MLLCESPHSYYLLSLRACLDVPGSSKTLSRTQEHLLPALRCSAGRLSSVTSLLSSQPPSKAAATISISQMGKLNPSLNPLFPNAILRNLTILKKKNTPRDKRCCNTAGRSPTSLSLLFGGNFLSFYLSLWSPPTSWFLLFFLLLILSGCRRTKICQVE